MDRVRRDQAIDRARGFVEARVDRSGAVERARAVLGDGAVEAAAAVVRAGRITVAFHPDRPDERGMTTAVGLGRDGRFLSQWESGASSGQRSAVPGGFRATWENEQFGVDDAVDLVHRPVYGALDLLFHRHGGSPAFGSCYLVLADHVRDRTTFAVGDTHLGPPNVGTVDAPWALLAGLAEQAATTGLLGQPLGVEGLRSVLDGDAVEAPRRTTDWYVEAQVHGGVDVARDVEAIVIDPSFTSGPVGEALAEAATAGGATLQTHAGTVLDPATLPASSDLHDWIAGDEDALAAITAALEELAGDRSRVTAADIGALLQGLQPPPRSIDGDDESSLLQHVKRLWRVTYIAGHDATTT